MAFQVSRLAGMLVRALRGAVGLDAWDGLVAGGCLLGLPLGKCDTRAGLRSRVGGPGGWQVGAC